ncbi:hypothetical protein NDU88_001868 [Pleurodeles waltl]|uniref:SH3 domain-containing protein n=1 Tax=Pleurodeles waltl TaxID=8319 RepID=A0AAV7VD54_PLEWA|nr:hypothetical protein NDU88_001868 [Pleurodeles waltl]
MVLPLWQAANAATEVACFYRRDDTVLDYKEESLDKVELVEYGEQCVAEDSWWQRNEGGGEKGYANQSVASILQNPSTGQQSQVRWADPDRRELAGSSTGTDLGTS